MASWVDIGNQALRRLGADRIQALDEGSEAANAVNDVHRQAADEVCAAHPFNCCLVRTTLPADSATPAHGYAFQYTLPTDPLCLRVWTLGAPDIAYAVENGKILTDEKAPLAIRYLAQVADPLKFPPHVATAIAARIALAIAYRITNSGAREAAMNEWFETAIRSARALDGQEGTPESLGFNDFLAARR
jgi:hypothetical protein